MNPPRSIWPLQHNACCRWESNGDRAHSRVGGEVSAPAPRDPAERRRDAMAALEDSVDVWVASASVDATGVARPHLVPLSLAWIDDRVVVAVGADSRTARNLNAGGRARLAVGSTRDVVIIDAVVEQVVPVAEAPVLADRYAARADWDPRHADNTHTFFVLRPDRIQAWRESNELTGRTLMRQGRWIV